VRRTHAAGRSEPAGDGTRLAVALDHANTLGRLDSDPSMRFLAAAAGGAVAIPATSRSGAGQAASLLSRTLARASHSLGFPSGARLDLHSLLTDAPLSQDLTNVGGLLRGLHLAPEGRGPGSGGRTAFETAGSQPHLVPHGQGSGNLDVSDPSKHNPLLPPSG